MYTVLVGVWPVMLSDFIVIVMFWVVLLMPRAILPVKMTMDEKVSCVYGTLLGGLSIIKLLNYSINYEA